MSSAEQVTAIRESQFAAFSASVEVGLQEYLGPEGPQRLMKAMIYRYCPEFEVLKRIREDRGKPIKPSQEEKEKRELKEARRQIALLFSLLEVYQPVDEITKLLGSLDDASIDSVIIEDPGSGYAPGYGPPNVIFPSPDGGDMYNTAQGRAVLHPNGKILRIDLEKRGSGYTKPPIVSISPPVGENNPLFAASAKAFIFRDGPYKGKLERIQMVNPGDTYSTNQSIRVDISPPDLEGGERATATAVLEYEVQSIQIIDGGSGYAAEKRLNVFVESPPVTARVNLNDPMTVRMLSPNQLMPSNNAVTAQRLKPTPSIDDPSSISKRVWNEAKVGGGGGCIGRACYDKPVIAIAYPHSDNDSYTSFRKPDDIAKIESIEDAVQKRSSKSINGGDNSHETILREDDSVSMLPLWSSGSFSSKFLSLLPSGIGLTYNNSLRRYELTQADISKVGLGEGRVTKPIDPGNCTVCSTAILSFPFLNYILIKEFGPRGRSPIEREKELDVDKLLRFCLSGALCCSSVHIVLTPIDVIKTRIQTNPEKYTDVVTAYKKVTTEQGYIGLFSGWDATVVGFFVFGGITFVATEYFRRFFSDIIGNSSNSLDLVVILAAAVRIFIVIQLSSECDARTYILCLCV
jgi:hypothetical protein